MTDGPVRLTRRRLLGSMVTVGGGGAATGAGTMALFSDSETSSDNTIKAGTLNLKLGGGHETIEFLKRTNLEPSDEPEGPAMLPVQNTGSVPGYLTVQVASIDGGLQEHLRVKAEFKKRGSLWDGYRLAKDELTTGETYSIPNVFNQDESDRFEFSWHLPSSTGEEAEGETLEFALTFRLTQHLNP